jgi:hypothetical protein
MQFVDFAKQVCELLISQGHWADYLDPASGLPVSFLSADNHAKALYPLDLATRVRHACRSTFWWMNLEKTCSCLARHGASLLDLSARIECMCSSCRIYCKSRGHWIYTEADSGRTDCPQLPYVLQMIHQNTNTVYSEVDALSTLLSFTCQNAGCCKVILHPKWGSSVYPATFFAKAPLESVLDAIRKVDEQSSQRASRISN